MARGLGINKRGFANSSVISSSTTPIAGTELSAPVSLYLPFDSDLNDDAQYTLSGTASGSAAINTGTKQFGAASLYTPSDGDYVTYDDSGNSISFSGNYTIEAWVYFTDVTTDNNYIWSKRTNTSTHSNNAWAVKWMGGSDNAWEIFQAQGSSQHVTFHSDTISTNTWYHLAVVRSGTNLLLFRDGTLISGTNTTGAGGTLNNPTSTNIVLGDIMGGTSALGFSGYIDDFRISDGVARYTKDFIPPSQAVGAKLTGSNETNTTTALTAFYAPFDSDLNDDSTNAGTGTAGGSAAISSTQAKFGGNSLYMGTGNHSVTYPNTTDFDFGTGPFTVEFWAYATATAYGNFESVMGFGGASNWHVSYVPGDSSNDGGYFEFSGGLGGYTGIDGVGQGAAAQWMHIAFTRDDSNTVRYFVNGTIKNTSTNTSSRVSGGDTFKIGYGGLLSYRSFQGYLDDIRIIKGYAKYTADFAPPTSAVGTSVSETVNDLTVLYLPFDDSSMEDQARNHSITKEGTVAISTSVKKLGTSSAYFATNDDELHITGSKFDLGTSFTIEGWYYLTDYTVHSVAFQYEQVGLLPGKDEFLLSLGLSGNGSAGQIRARLILNDGAENIWIGGDSGSNYTSSPSLNTWFHMAFVRDGASLYLFKDGVQLGITQTITNSTLSLSTSGNNTLVIGGSAQSPTPYSDHGMKGYIDDFRIVDGVALYTSNFTPPTSPVGLAVESGGVTTTTVENKFLSSVWSLKDQNKKISKGEWIRNDAADTGVNAEGRSIKGAGLQVDGHRWYIEPPTIPGVQILAVGAGGNGGNPSAPGVQHTSGGNTVFTDTGTSKFILAHGGGGASLAGGGVGGAGGGAGGFVTASDLQLTKYVGYTVVIGGAGDTLASPTPDGDNDGQPGGSGGGGTYIGGGAGASGGTGLQPSIAQPFISGIPGASGFQNLGTTGSTHPPKDDNPGTAGNSRGGGAGSVLGTSSSITGTSVTYAGGGYSGNRDSNHPNLTNPGPGGNGGFGSNNPGGAGVRGGGGGGFGGGGGGVGGAGGPGMLIIAYPDSEADLTITGTLSYTQPTRSGYKVYEFTSGSGTISIDT